VGVLDEQGEQGADALDAVVLALDELGADVYDDYGGCADYDYCDDCDCVEELDDDLLIDYHAYLILLYILSALSYEPS